MREQDLLKAALTNDWAKMLRIFAGEKRSMLNKISKTKKKETEETLPEWPTDESGAIVPKDVRDVKIDCRDQSGSTPLILAALGGHTEAVQCLLAHGANIHSKDSQGNTALHMAAWQNKQQETAKMVELLLTNGADACEQNTKGETPLHIAAQSGQVFTAMTLLEHGADCNVKAVNGDSPLDVAARNDKRDIVALLLYHDRGIVKFTRSIREAARTGRVQIVRLLLDAGMDVTAADPETQETALHESIRFARTEVTEELLKFGADPYFQNANGDTPVSLLESLPENQTRVKLQRLIEEYKSKEVVLPAVLLDERMQQRAQGAAAHEDSLVKQLKAGARQLPPFRVRDRWTEDTARFRSSADPRHPPTNLLRDDPSVYWEASATEGLQWVIFDFKAMYSVTAIDIIGAFSRHMPKECQLSASSSMDGPWRVVKTCTIAPDKQTCRHFDGFFSTSQYYRLQVLRNHGASTIRLPSVRFYGVDATLTKWFSELGCTQYYDAFVAAGINQRADLPFLTKAEIAKLVSLPGHQKKIELAIKEFSGESETFDRLVFSQPPVRKWKCNELLPPIEVQASPGITEEVRLVLHGGAIMDGTLVRSLRSNGPNPSSACFDDIVVENPGRYLVEVCGVQSSSVALRASQPITFVDDRRGLSATEVLFSDMKAVLNF